MTAPPGPDPFGAQGRSRPLAIAHRAGNGPADLRAAEAAGADLVELDLWLYRGRLEVRHLKTLGPLPVLWDRWELRGARGPRLLLPEVLGAVGPGTRLMLDLKGRDPRLPGLLLAALGRHLPGRAVTACSRTWAHLDALAGAPGVGLVYSVGSPRQLAAWWRRFPAPTAHGVSIHARLLTQELVRALRARSGGVVTWPVNTVPLLESLAAWGVDGVTTDDLAVVRRVVAGRSDAERSGGRGS